MQVSALIYTMGRETEHVLKSFTLAEGDDSKIGVILAQYFSQLDAASGSWQIPLHPESANLTTFITPVGRFCFKRLPLGITSTSEIFQCLMTDMPRNEEGCEAIIDDVILFGRSAEEHDENLNRTSHQGVKTEKCEIKKDSLTYFGHVVSVDGLSPDPEKVKAITELQAPTNYAELLV